MLLLKNYQKKAVKEIVSIGLKMLNSRISGDKVCYLQSIMASGKTVMIADSLDKISKKHNRDICCIWASPKFGSLPDQSQGVVSNHLKNSWKYTNQDDVINQGEIFTNQICFVNWETLVYKDNFVKDTEKHNFKTIISNTLKKDKDIILVIDEEHYQSNTEKANDIIKKLCASFTIRTSATLRLDSDSIKDREDLKLVSVNILDVIKEKMIRNEIVLNSISHTEVGSTKTLISNAVETQNKLIEKYKKEKVYDIPVILIQIVDGKEGKILLEECIDKLSNYNISEENNNLVIYMDKHKTQGIDINNIPKNVKVVMFKRALSNGWDCPRVQLIIELRNFGTDSFKYQSMGRALRALHRKYYKDEALNKMYVYTDNENFNVSLSGYEYLNKFIKNKGETVTLKTYSNFRNIKLKSIWRDRRQRNNDISYKMFKDTFYRKIREVDIKFLEGDVAKKLQGEQSYKVEDIYNNTIKNNREEINVKRSDKEIGNDFKEIIYTKCMSNLAKRSLDKICKIIIEYIKRKYNVNNIQAQEIFLNNKDLQNILSNASDIHYNTLQKEKKLRDKHSDLWSAREEYDISDFYKKNYKKYAYNENIIRRGSDLENEFDSYLDNNENIIEWLKNGDKTYQEFGISYMGIENTGDILKEKVFMPDHIVLFPGIIGIFDPKGDQDINIISKAKALYIYLKNNKKQNGYKLIGGIIQKHPRGEWIINRKEEYKSYKDNPSDWEYLVDVIEKEV